VRFAYLIEPPFNYVDRAGRLTGCDVELARYVSGALGLPGFEPIETQFSNLLPGLQTGAWDMTTGLFSTPERQRLAHFSRPIWALPDGLLVKHGNPDGLRGYASFAERPALRLAVVRDQVQHQTAQAAGVSDGQVQVFASYNAAADAVLTGRVNAHASVARAHVGYVSQHPGCGLGMVDVSLEEATPAPGAFAVSRDDPGILDAVNQALSGFLGTKAHRDMMQSFGFSAEDVGLTL